LLDSVVGYCFEPLEKEYRAIVDSDIDPVKKLEQFIKRSLEYTEKHKKLFHQVRNVMFRTTDQYIGDQDSWYWLTIGWITTMINEAVNSGKFRSMNTKKVAALFIDSINSLMAHRILSENNDSIEGDVKEMMSLYTNGMQS